VDDRLGWAGGWGDRNFQGGFTSETRDGGETWTDANHVGKFLNRFRFIREPELVGYASGDSVYKYSSEPVTPPALGVAIAPEQPEAFDRARFPIQIPVSSAPGAETVRVDVWDRFGEHLATPLEETALPAGAHEVSWSGETESGRAAGPGLYIYRVTIGDTAESRTVLVEA
jgi:FlgD Ig-like domain